ncbi:MAG: TIGR00730 family Rossman fold protein [Ruminococcaceae bacterium]|nr:TIGR00730 family Rossman fold protein [Oscillospiraceae bacterium]
MNICVYGASSNDINNAYIKAGEQLGELIAQRGHGLVFGGGANGMMGAVARGMHAFGGRIIGVAPEFFNVDGELFENCSEMIGTATMRERKRIMEERADAFVVTPGGIGTFDEFFEILTLKNLGLHDKPVVLLNTLGYFNSMISMLENAVAEGFASNRIMSLFEVKNDPQAVLECLDNN